MAKNTPNKPSKTNLKHSDPISRQSLMKRNAVEWLARTVPALVLALVVTGCASFQPAASTTVERNDHQQWVNLPGTVTLLTERQTEILAKSRRGQNVSLGTTPWGKNTRLTVNPSYFAASGSECFSTEILSSSGITPVVVCQTTQTRWAVTGARSTGGNRVSQTAEGSRS